MAQWKYVTWQEYTVSYFSVASEYSDLIYTNIQIYTYICRCIYIYTNTNAYIYIYIYIHGYVFRPSQHSSVWLRLTSREQLMSSECSKHQVEAYIIYQEAYIIWCHLWYTSVKWWYLVSKFWFFGLLVGERAKNDPKWQKILSVVLHISRFITWLLFVIH